MMQKNQRVMTRLLWVIAASIMVCNFFALPAFSSADASSPSPLRIGFLGDSSTDEYQGTDNRGGAYAGNTYNWMELLVVNRSISAGTWGDWPEPRRTGYEYNWSRSAATVGSLLGQGQHTGLAEQVANGEIDIVIINIGINDFAVFNGHYEAVYNGDVAGEALETGIVKLVEAYTTAVDTILAARSIPVIISTIGDQNLSPAVMNDSRFSDPAKRLLVSNAIQDVNTALIAMANERGLSYLDATAVLSRFAAWTESGAVIGEESINVFEVGDEPHYGFLGDSIHPGTVLNSILANEYLALINGYVEPDIPLLTDSEILLAAGLG
jgi:hypothetical protein